MRNIYVEGYVMRIKRNKILLGLLVFLMFSVAIPISELSFFNNVTEVYAASPIKINKKKAVLIKGQSEKLKISGTKKKIKWTSSKKSIVTVAKDGKIVAKKKGKATITAKVENKTFKCVVTVETPSLNKTNITLKAKEKYKLKLTGTTQKIKWTSSNSGVASVKNGDVTAKGTGTAYIYAQVGKKSYKCKVTVKASPILSVSKTNVTCSTETSVNVTLRGNGSVKYSIGNTGVVKCEWGTFNGDTIPLKIIPVSEGRTTVRISNTINNETVVINIVSTLKYSDDVVRAGYAVRLLYSLLKDNKTLEIVNAGYFINNYGNHLVCIDYKAKNSYGGIVYKNLSVNVADTHSPGFGYVIKPKNYPKYITVGRNSAPRYGECTSRLNIASILEYANTYANYQFTYYRPYYTNSWVENDPLGNELIQ